MWCLCKSGSKHDTIRHRFGTAHTNRQAFWRSRQEGRLRRSDCSGEGGCIGQNGERRASRRKGSTSSTESVGGANTVREEPVPAVGAVTGAPVATATNDDCGDPFSVMGDDDGWTAIVEASFVDRGTLAAIVERGTDTARVLQESGALGTARNPPGADRQRKIPGGSCGSKPPPREPGGGSWLGTGSSGTRAASDAAVDNAWRRTGSDSVLALEALGGTREVGTACNCWGGVNAAAAASDKQV